MSLFLDALCVFSQADRMVSEYQSPVYFLKRHKLDVGTSSYQTQIKLSREEVSGVEEPQEGGARGVRFCDRKHRPPSLLVS